MHSYTVVVTPASGAVFMAMFLPPTATIIVLDVWRPVEQPPPVGKSCRYWADDQLWNRFFWND